MERVVSQAELDRPDPTLTEQMRRLQLSHSTGHTSTPSLALCTRESVMTHEWENLEQKHTTNKKQCLQTVMCSSPPDERVSGLEAELAEEQSQRREAEEQSQRREAEERAQTEQQRQEAERRATQLAKEKQEAERNNQILRSEKAGNPCNNSRN